jgi:hypothetical protein
LPKLYGCQVRLPNCWSCSKNIQQVALGVVAGGLGQGDLGHDHDHIHGRRHAKKCISWHYYL